ncbi:MAG: DUF4190 domain-containing protein [Angustibacter sp.]
MSQPPPYGAGYSRPGAGPAFGNVPPGTNGFAISAFVCGLLGVALLGVIFGIVALGQVKRTGQQGRGLAIAGIVVSAAWVAMIGALVAIALAVGLAAESSRGDEPVSAFSLAVGDCVNGLGGTGGLGEDSEFSDLPSVPCSAPHEGEVFATFDLPSGSFPGRDSVSAVADEGCEDRLGGYAPHVRDDPDFGISTLFPSALSWIGGDREVVCLVVSSNGRTTGSLRDGGSGDPARAPRPSDVLAVAA